MQYLDAVQYIMCYTRVKSRHCEHNFAAHLIIIVKRIFPVFMKQIWRGWTVCEKWCVSVQFIWASDFPLTPYVQLLVGWSYKLLIGWSFYHNFLKGQEVALPCSSQRPYFYPAKLFWYLGGNINTYCKTCPWKSIWILDGRYTKEYNPMRAFGVFFSL